MMRRLVILLCLPALAFGFTKLGTTYTTDGSFADVKAAVADASTGDTVNIPAGTFASWGSGGAISTGKQITIAGAGPASTIITSTGSPTIFNISGPVTVKDFRFNGGGSGTVLFNLLPTSGGNAVIGARFTNLILDYRGGTGSRFFYGSRAFALADNCYFYGGGGNNEYIYALGPTDAWNFPAQIGTDKALYFENCFFDGDGYPDLNAAASGVFRMCVVVSASKFDAHGYASNSNAPQRSARFMEIYGNRWLWTSTSVGSFRAIEHRGGLPIVFGNSIEASAAAIGTYRFTDYGFTGMWTLYSFEWQTPYLYPLPDQIGAGPGTISLNNDRTGTQVGGAEPGVFWLNKKAGVRASISRAEPPSSVNKPTTGTAYSIGASSIEVSGATSNSPLRAGNYIAIAGDNTRYRLTNTVTTSPATISFTPGLAQAIPASVTQVLYGPFVNYQAQTGNPTATFTASDVIALNRDIVVEGVSFDGSGGVGIGTKAQMLAITPTSNAAHYWVKDEGTWNTSFTGTQAATALKQWDWCEIVTLGTTNWQAIGAPIGAGVGDYFLASGPGDGDGTAKPAQGRLYRAAGSTWVQRYEPYPYPHPLRNTGPDVTAPMATATIQPSGTILAIALSEACTAGAGGTGGITLSASGGPVTATYQSGNGTSQWLYHLDRTVIGTETVTWSYSTANGIEDAAGNDLAPVTAAAVTNTSTESVINADPNPWRAAVVPGIF